MSTGRHGMGMADAPTRHRVDGYCPRQPRTAPAPAGCLGCPDHVRAGHFYRPEQNRTFEIAELGHARMMTIQSEMLTVKEFASLLAVGNVRVNDLAPVIPAEHSARFTALGYMADFDGRLRLTTPGRIRIVAGV
jgi:hypothetical protein